MNYTIYFLVVFQTEKMPSILHFQTSSFRSLWITIFVSTFVMKILAKPTVFFVSKAVTINQSGVFFILFYFFNFL